MTSETKTKAPAQPGLRFDPLGPTVRRLEELYEPYGQALAKLRELERKRVEAAEAVRRHQEDVSARTKQAKQRLDLAAQHFIAGALVDDDDPSKLSGVLDSLSYQLKVAERAIELQREEVERCRREGSKLLNQAVFPAWRDAADQIDAKIQELRILFGRESSIRSRVSGAGAMLLDPISSAYNDVTWLPIAHALGLAGG